MKQTLNNLYKIELKISFILIRYKRKTMASKQQLQLCIPKVSNEITKQYIINIFNKLQIGKIYKVFENPLRSDPLFKRIVLFINWDNTKELAKEIQETLKDPKEHMNVVYNMPWYWQIYANHQQR